ncbi:MAG: FAD-dependent oxidoreductase, partial [Polynucleobacter victoriensis]
MHRRDVLKAPDELLAKFEQLRTSGQVTFKAGQITELLRSNIPNQEIKVTNPDGSTNHLNFDALLVYLGISPQLGPIAEWGVDLERKQVPVDTAKFQTNVPGIFAIGDINTYPG